MNDAGLNPGEDALPSGLDALSMTGIAHVDRICDRFEEAWRSGERPQIESFLVEIPGLLHPWILRECLLIELELREEAGDEIALQEYLARFPEHAKLVQTIFEEEEWNSASSGSIRVRGGSQTAASKEHASTIERRPSENGVRPSVSDDGSTTAQDASPAGDGLMPGDLIGPYRLLSYVDGGGMGTVWRAWADTNEQIVALKLIRHIHGPHGTAADNSRRIALFQREMRAATRLNGHPHIVPVYFAHCDHGRYYYTMPFVDGLPLNRWIRRNGPAAPRVAARIIRSVADALRYAHDHGVLHRDVTSRNILIDREDAPHVLDFGLACFLEAAGEERALAVGTVPYMAPECFLTDEAVTTCADVFSLGVTLFETLTGRRPFDGSNERATMRNILSETAPRPSAVRPGIPIELDLLCLRCLEKPAEQRPTAGELVFQLDRFLTYKPVSGVPYTPWRRVRLFLKRSPSAGAAVILALTAMAMLGFFLFNQRREAVNRVQQLVQRLRVDPVSQVPPLLWELRTHGALATAAIESILSREREPSIQARLRLALSEPSPARLESLIRRMITTSDSDEFRLIRDEIADLAIPATGFLLREASEDTPAGDAAAAAVLTWHLNGRLDRRSADAVTTYLHPASDATRSNRILARLDATAFLPEQLIPRLAEEPDPHLRLAIVFSLGAHRPSSPALENKLLDAYANDPDAAVHAALFMTLRSWGLVESLTEVNRRLVLRDAPGDGVERNGRSWFVNSQGQTFIVIEPPPGDAWPDGLRPFALAMTETRLGDYIRLMPPPTHDLKLLRCDGPALDVPGNLHRPVECVSGIEAMQYCRKLSEVDRVALNEMCYPPSTEMGPYFVPQRGFERRHGWRLPTPAEWDLACRAGTSTDHFFGRDAKELTRFAWIRSNAPDRVRPVGMLRPNPWGLLDILGNVAEWCSDPDPPSCGHDPSAHVAPEAKPCPIQQPTRGGSFQGRDASSLSFRAFKDIAPFVDTRMPWTGFRLARTLRGSPASPIAATSTPRNP